MRLYQTLPTLAGPNRPRRSHPISPLRPPQGITDLDVCSIAWNNPVPWRKIAGDFGEGAIMEQWAGYVLVLGFGVFFSIVTTIMVKLEQIYGGLVISSEHFNTAGRNIKTGLTAAVRHPNPTTL